MTSSFLVGICDWAAHLSAGIFAFTILGLLFWKADDILSENGRKIIYERITAVAANPNDPAIVTEISTFLKHYYSREVPAFRAYAYVILFSLSALAMMLCFYIAQTPGLLCQLISDSMARRLFLGQVVGNGVVVLLLTNFFGYLVAQFAMGVSPQFGALPVYRTLLAEVFVKLLLFVMVTSVVYVAYATYAGSFTGDPMLALKAVRPTISDAIWFRNLTSVYLYSAAISSFPLFLVVLIRFMSTHPIFAHIMERSLFWFNFQNRPIRALAVALGILFGGFSIAAYLVLICLRLAI